MLTEESKGTVAMKPGSSAAAMASVEAARGARRSAKSKEEAGAVLLEGRSQLHAAPPLDVLVTLQPVASHPPPPPPLEATHRAHWGVKEGSGHTARTERP